jgi:diguanylate cyclase (GGDEF)-like protein/PAS domain S-box-containing protein
MITMSDKEVAVSKEESLTKGRILVVDSEARHADSLAMILNNRGYDAEIALYGAKAVTALVSKPIDLVLLDIHMPVLNGHKLMAFISKHNIKTQIIAISGDPSMDDAIEFLKKGADNYIQKPVSPTVLLNAVEESLLKRAQQLRDDGLRHKAELRSNLHRLMFDIAPNLLFVLDAKGCFRMVNNVFCKVTGYSKQELRTMHWKALVEVDQVERLQHIFEERRTTPDQSPEVELRLKCKDAKGRVSAHKRRTVLVALQSRRLYTQRGDKKIFFGIYGVARDITHHSKLEELSKYQEFHDNMTGLPNRVLFDDYLSFALIQAKHNGTGICLLNIVIDDLKQVNERYGHAVGDICLKTLASRLKHQVRRGDTLARVDGSEFLLLLPNIRDESTIVPMAEKIRVGLTQAVVVDGKSISVQVSVGTALFPRDGETTDALLREAKNHSSVPAQSGERQQPAVDSSNWIKLIERTPVPL